MIPPCKADIPCRFPQTRLPEKRRSSRRRLFLDAEACRLPNQASRPAKGGTRGNHGCSHPGSPFSPLQGVCRCMNSPPRRSSRPKCRVRGSAFAGCARSTNRHFCFRPVLSQAWEMCFLPSAPLCASPILPLWPMRLFVRPVPLPCATSFGQLFAN